MAKAKTKVEVLANQEIINRMTFSQLTEFDEDEPDFSKGIADQYYQQADTTFKEMKEALETKDLKELARLAHFLKGSSGQLGLRKVAAEFNRMQYYGKLRDEDKDKDLDETAALNLIEKHLAIAKTAHKEAKDLLELYYAAPGDPLRMDDVSDEEE